MDFKLDKPLYKYRSFKSAKQFLETSALYFSSPSQFNDPFEFSDKLLDFTTPKAYVKKYVTELVEAQPGTRKERRQKLKFDLQPIFLNAVRGTLKQKRTNCGVFCSSALYDHTLMWSHYANEHKGVCIGIEFPQTKAFLNDFILKEEILSLYVNYMDSITTIPCVINDTLFPKETLTHWITAKSKVWEYEKEMRLIKFKNHGSVTISKD